MRRAWLLLAVSVACASLGWSPAPGAGLAEAPWPMRSRDFGASASLPDVGITKRNVGALKLLWRFPADDAIPDAPAVGSESVVVGSARGTLYALDPDTGRVKWRVSVGAISRVAYGFTSLGIGGTPAIVRGRVYTATAATDVVCLDEATGGLMWRTRIGNPALGETVWTAPLVWQGRVYVGVDGVIDEPITGRLVALDAATGKVEWVYVIPQYTGGGGAGVLGSPSLDPATGTLFVATGNPSPGTDPPPGPDPGSDSILALDAVTGRLKWAFGPTHPHDTKDRDFLSTPNVFTVSGRTTVGAGEKDGVYYAVDAQTGRRVWSTSLTTPRRGAVITGSAAVAQGKIFVGTQDYPPEATGFSPTLPGRLVALDSQTGRIVWVLEGPKQILGTPAVADGVVFAADYGGTVWGVDADTGRPLWKASAGGFAFKSGLSLAPGRLFVGVAAPANALAAFGLPGERVARRMLPSVARTALGITFY
jgi:polyvinyl alcohol dehydrogenase (cytochrome)